MSKAGHLSHKLYENDPSVQSWEYNSKESETLLALT